MYKVKEIFYTLQGEGKHTGRPAVFCRFSGCNLWSGREEDRHKAICTFCDTDFRGTDGALGGVYTGIELAKTISSLWPDPSQTIFLVCTGGEPALQLDDALIQILHNHNIYVAVETNGTVPLSAGIDWVCVSPKSNTEIVVKQGDELKLVYPQLTNHPSDYAHLHFSHFYIQPLDDIHAARNTEACINFCKQNPKWSLSLQTHKFLGID